MRNDYIPLVFCFDNKFAPYAAVAIYSYHLSAISPLKIYCLVSSLDQTNTNILKALRQKFGIDIVVIGVADDPFSGWKEVNHITRAAYLRLLIPDAIPEDRVIYLDCDTFGLGDLRQLYEIPLNGAFIGGVCDEFGAKTSRMPFHPDNQYINSGVLLMDLAGLRRDYFFDQCREIYFMHSEEVTWADQCVINKYAEQRKIILQSYWNRQVYPNQLQYADVDLLTQGSEVAIIHFIGAVKPWMEWCNPKVLKLWQSYVDRTALPDIHSMKLSSTDHALSLVSVLDLNRDFEQSGLIKNQIIDSLMRALELNQSKA